MAPAELQKSPNIFVRSEMALNLASPFSEVFLSLAHRALSGLTAPRVIREAFARHLTARFGEVLARCVYAHFTAHRETRRIFDGTTHGCYASFIRHLSRGGLTEILREYPAGAKAIEVIGSQARDFASDFAKELQRERRAIADLVGTPQLGHLMSVSPGWSDPRSEGRTVIRVSFESGGTIFYKPRSVAVDRLWSAGLKRLSRKLPLPLKAASVIDCGDHGWSKAIVEVTAMTRSQADEFYWRYGALLCLAWWLDAVDLHRGNVITCRGHPVLVDAEGLMHPLRSGERRTLARTGIIPSATSKLDFSGLGAGKEQQFGPIGVWGQLDSDELTLRNEMKTIPAASHFPRVGGVPRTPAQALRLIREGFEAVSRVALREPGMIAEWRYELAAAPRRRIDRPTSEYVLVLSNASRPENLRSLAAWKRQLTYFPAGLVRRGVAREEFRQLARWDIPHFESQSNDIKPPCREELEACLQQLRV